MMGQIITIMPYDWTKFPLEETAQLIGRGLYDFKQAENQGNFTDISEMMTNAGLIPEGKSMVSGVMVINEDRELYMQFL